MFRSQHFKPLLYLKSLIRTQLQTPKPPSSTLSLKHASTISTSDKNQFAVSYLVNNCGLSPETALQASKFIQFETVEKPDSVISFFRNNGFTNTQICSIIKGAPSVLTCDPHKRVLPKFEFLISKGASSSYVVELVSKSPRILYSSLENNIVPTYELLRRFLKSDKKTMNCMLGCGHFFGSDRVAQNVKLLIDDGVSDHVISFLLQRRLAVILGSRFKGGLDEIKEMGFDPSKLKFAIALLAKRAVSKSRWEAKISVFKSWGWSEEFILCVFKKQPSFMLVSPDKIDGIMRFWVKQLGWDSLLLAKKPEMFGFSLERRIIPRGLVVQYLLAKGLWRQKASLTTPFSISDQVFLKKYVMPFKEDKCELLKLYQPKMSGERKKEDQMGQLVSLEV